MEIFQVNREKGYWRRKANIHDFINILSEFYLFSGLSLSALHHIPRRPFSGINEKTIKMFHLKPSEVKRAKELEKLLQPLNSYSRGDENSSPSFDEEPLGLNSEMNEK